MESEMIPITLWLAERSYRIKIKKDHEEAIRLAAKTAEERVNEMRRTFAGKDTQDFLAMALLLYAASSVTEPDELSPSGKDKLKEMIGQIDTLLDPEN